MCFTSEWKWNISIANFRCGSRFFRAVRFMRNGCSNIYVGPTENTIDDFLRMIVEQKIEMIVMLSSTYEPITQTFAVCHEVILRRMTFSFVFSSANMHLILRRKPVRLWSQNSSQYEQNQCIQTIVLLFADWKYLQRFHFIFNDNRKRWLQIFFLLARRINQ